MTDSPDSKTPYLVKWIDSTTLDGAWVSRAEAEELLEEEHPLCETVGVIVSENEHWLVLACSVAKSGDQLGGVIAIPKVAVKSIEVLRCRRRSDRSPEASNCPVSDVGENMDPGEFEGAEGSTGDPEGSEGISSRESEIRYLQSDDWGSR